MLLCPKYPQSSLSLCRTCNGCLLFIYSTQMQWWYMGKKQKGATKRKKNQSTGTTPVFRYSTVFVCSYRSSLRHAIYKLTPPSCSIPSMLPSPKSKSMSLRISPSSASEMFTSMFVGTADGETSTLSVSCLMGSPDAN